MRGGGGGGDGDGQRVQERKTEFNVLKICNKGELFRGLKGTYHTFPYFLSHTICYNARYSY